MDTAPFPARLCCRPTPPTASRRGAILARGRLWVAVLAALATLAAAAQEAVVLSGPGQVVDGWIASAGGGQAFDAPALRAEDRKSVV